MRLYKGYITLSLFVLFMMVLPACHILRVADDDKDEKINDVSKEEPDITRPDNALEEISELIALPDPGILNIEKTASGIEYAVFEAGSGAELEPGMQVRVHYAGYLGSDNTRFDSSYERNEPIMFTLGRNMVIRGWEEALINLRVGDKARVWIPSELAYGDKGRGPIPPNTDLIFDLEVLDGEQLFKPEKTSLAHKDTIEIDSGLQIIMIRDGTGELPARGSVLVVHYSGYLSDGTLFDSSLQRSVPIRFVYATGQVLRGWDEGFAYLNKGAKARLIIPPHLAYGDRGAGPIPPKETLIFDVELIDIEY